MRSMHILIWVLAALALGFWTLLAWATAWVLGLDPAWLGSVANHVAEWPAAPWLDTWVPGWQELTVAGIELARTLLGWLGGTGQVLVWIVWGLGAALIVGLGALGSGVVAVVRRAASKPAVVG